MSGNANPPKAWTFAFAGLVTVLALGCATNGPDGRPEIACNERCRAKASARCSADECVRGCRFILDRLIEHEGNHVVDCVAKSKAECTDPTWATCAVAIGPHADGGPPAIPPAVDEE